jgi:phage shock protein PspC (stress-responsive transcriptional regulator)
LTDLAGVGSLLRAIVGEGRDERHSAHGGLEGRAQSPTHEAPGGRHRTRYHGLYCSTDAKVLIGLCGGLAHKFGLDVGYVRAGVFLVGFFVIWLPYLLGFFLPRLPTKGISRPV